MNKIYRAIVCGQLKNKLTLGGRLAKDHDRNMVSVVDDESGKEALTYVTPLGGDKRLTLVEVELVTGRTHQIRVHLADAGHPVAGDTKYGNRKINKWISQDYGVNSQLLHACRLELGELEGELEYLSGKVFEAPLPEPFDKILEDMK